MAFLFPCLNSFFYFAAGACLGSFLNVCALRIPEGLSIVHPPSRCPRCGHSLTWYENIPILSFLVLRGRCRSCSKAISWQYPLVEALTGLFFALSASRFEAEPWSWAASWSWGDSASSFPRLTSEP